MLDITSEHLECGLTVPGQTTMHGVRVPPS